ncbi:MAG TPA: PEGA domain-containing protein [Kofleriaceae bacterium]
MRVLALGVMLATLAVLAPPSRADDQANRETARREFALAQDDDRAGRFEAAIGHYQRANDVLPHPFNLYNIAVDYERLGNLRQAAEFYEQYVAAAPASPDHDRVTRTIADLKAHDSPLSVRSIPEGAQVQIDGKPAGVTPVATKLPGGTHHVIVDLDGQHGEKDVALEFGEPGDVAFTLGGQAGTLVVEGAPFGAYVAVDNITIGAMPATTQISAGTHHVRVSAAGYTPFETTVDVAANGQTHVNAELVRAVPVVAVQPAQDSSSTVAFLAGAGGGGELHGGALGFGMIGTRILRYDLVFRIGRADTTLAYDFILRWQILSGTVTPFLAVGYTYANNGYGYLALGGVRWDVVHQPHTLVSIVADVGFRDAPVSATDMTSATTSFIEPVELGVEVTFK